jgi:hypothetical protein
MKVNTQNVKKVFPGTVWCIPPVTPVSWEAEIRRITGEDQPHINQQAGQWWFMSVVAAIQET